MHINSPSKAFSNKSSIYECLLSAEGKFLYVADPFLKVLGYRAEDLIGKAYTVFLHPEDVNAAETLGMLAINGKESKTKSRFLSKRGTYHPQEEQWLPLKDGAGNLQAIKVLVAPGETADLNENQQPFSSKAFVKESVSESFYSEKLYNSLFENYPDLVLVTDAQGLIIKSNEHDLKKDLDDSSQLAGKNVLEFLSAENRTQLSTKLPGLLKGHSAHLEVHFEKAHNPFYALLTFVPFNEDGRIIGFFVMLRDISEKVKHEQELTLINTGTLTLSNALSLSIGMQEVLKLLCQFGGFHYGEFWMPMFGINYLVMKSQWVGSDTLNTFADISKKRKFQLPHDLPPLIAEMKPRFFTDLQKPDDFNRKEVAKEHGLKSLLTVPLIYNDTFLGAVVLFSNKRINKLPLSPEEFQRILNKLGAEIEKRQANEELDKFFTLTPDLLGIVGFDGLFKKINPAFEQVLGFTQEEFYMRPYLDFIHPDDINQTIDAVTLATQGIPSEGFTIRCKHKDGHFLWISWTNKPATDEGLIYIAGRDVSEERKQLEEINRIKVAIENTSDAICIGKSLEECMYTNKAFEKILGWNCESINKNGGLISILGQAEKSTAIYQSLLKKGQWQGDVEIKDIYGKPKAFNLRSNIVTGEDGTSKYVVGIFTDISEQQKAQREINKLSKAVEESANELYIIDPRITKFTYTNKRVQENLGYSANELKNIDIGKIAPEFSIEKGKEFVKPLMEGKSKNLTVKTFHVRKNGSRYPVEAHFSIFHDGSTPSIMAQTIDISDRLKTEEAFRIANERYQLAAKATNDAIWDWDLLTNNIFWGEGFYQLFGQNFTEDSKLDSWKNNIHPDDAKKTIENIFDVLHKGKDNLVHEYRFRCANGRYKHVRDRAYVIYDTAGKAVRVTGAMTDISEQKRNEELLQEFNNELEIKVSEKTERLQAALKRMKEEMLARAQTEQELQLSLKEKNILLKEIHHRVKNNMAIISSLLSLQARQVDQQKVKSLFKDSQSRIKSMALVHEHLYQNRNLASINFMDYIKELVQGISATFANHESKINFEVEAEDIELDIVYAVPCGLILNELITNCYKYAFKGREKGLISIHFNKRNEAICLKVIDNGVGTNEEILKNKTKSLGMQLVQSLVKQIGGSLTLNNQHGLAFTIVFNLTTRS